MEGERPSPVPATGTLKALNASGRETAGEPERWVDEHGDYLFGYALLHLHDAAAAQDAVQETFLAALHGQDSFRGTSAQRGWLLGILKHKIHDHFRRLSRETPFTHLDLQHDEETDQFVASGWQQGAWAPELAPADWSPEPGASLDQAAFWKVFRECTARLPRHTARAFLLREMDDLGSQEICTLLGITENNLWVLLHRARLALRRCLEKNWFAKLNA